MTKPDPDATALTVTITINAQQQAFVDRLRLAHFNGATPASLILRALAELGPELTEPPQVGPT